MPSVNNLSNVSLALWLSGQHAEFVILGHRDEILGSGVQFPPGAMHIFLSYLCSVKDYLRRFEGPWSSTPEQPSQLLIFQHCYAKLSKKKPPEELIGPSCHRVTEWFKGGKLKLVKGVAGPRSAGAGATVVCPPLSRVRNRVESLVKETHNPSLLLSLPPPSLLLPGGCSAHATATTPQLVQPQFLTQQPLNPLDGVCFPGSTS